MSPSAAGGVGGGGGGDGGGSTVATATAAAPAATPAAAPATKTATPPACSDHPSNKDVCWICLEDAETESGDAQTVLPCRCPRPVHPRCLARWQLQQAGREEERRCRFCRAELADWRTHLTPEALRPEVEKVQPVMVVYFEGQIHRIPVSNRGPGGLEEFTKKIRELFRLPEDVDISLTFGCKEPMSGSHLKLEGTGAFGAAVHCASVAAAERAARLRKQGSAGAVNGSGAAKGAAGEGAKEQHAAMAAAAGVVAPPPPPPRAASSPHLAASSPPLSPATPAPRPQEQQVAAAAAAGAAAAASPARRPRPASAPRRPAAAVAPPATDNAEDEEDNGPAAAADSPPRRRRAPSRVASRRLSHISQQDDEDVPAAAEQPSLGRPPRASSPPTPLQDLAALLPPVVSQLFSISRKVARSLSFTGGSGGGAAPAVPAAAAAAAAAPPPAIGASPRNPVGPPVSPRTLSLYESLANGTRPPALVAPGAGDDSGNGNSGSSGGVPSPAAAAATPPAALARPRAA